MKINRDNFKNEEKKLKKYYEEKEILDRIINHIKECRDYNELSNSVISYMYGFENLRNDLAGYYSFRLSKKSSAIRLLMTIDINSSIVNLEYISMNHYEDFKKKKNSR